jgi:Secretion system C-terminal sorting domain
LNAINARHNTYQPIKKEFKMRQKMIKSSLVLLMELGLTGVQAQEAIPAAGADASGSSGSVSYTVGQVVYTTNTGSNGTITQGVQQPYEIYVVTAIEEKNGISLNCMAYPNPASDFLILKIEGDKIGKPQTQYVMSLYDINGKLIRFKKINNNETNIAMSDLAPAIYFLKITQEQGVASQKEIKSFKIIKK